MNNNAIFQEKLNRIQEVIVDRFDEIIDTLGLDLTDMGSFYSGRCEIHGGNNSTALNLYKEGFDVAGYWRCNTHNCANLFYQNKKVFAANSLGFIRGILSSREFGWSRPGDNTYSFVNTLKFVEKTLNISIDNYQVNEEDLIKKNLLQESSYYISKDSSESALNLSIDYAQKKLKIPDPYFISRGFSKEILKKFHVGFCDNEKSPMYNRSVVPILNEQGNSIIGLTGRSNYPKCESCKNYHDDKSKSCEYKYSSKWKNLGNFKSTSLYNYWNAKDFIRSSKVTIVVEGPGDVIKLNQYGLNNCVGLFGVSLSDSQQFLLEKAGTMSIILLLDNPNIDEAGKIGMNQFIQKCGTIFRIFTLKEIYKDKKDVGEFDDEQIKELKLFIEKVERIYK